MNYKIKGTELLSTDEMIRADSLAVNATKSSFDLMKAAGLAVFRVLRKSWTWRNVLVLCGPGNNGGDGFIVASLLRDAGWPVKVGLLGNISDLKGDVSLAVKHWQGETSKITPDLFGEADLIVDGLFGAGLSRDIDGITKDLINEINQTDIDCLSIDLPSGIDGNTGQVKGCAICAKETVTFFRKKPGHLLLPGRHFSGKIHLKDIGITPSVLRNIKPNLYENAVENWREHFPYPRPTDYKYSRGHTVIGGGMDMPGAALLAARASRRIGSGMTTIIADEITRNSYSGRDPGILFRTLGKRGDFEEIISDPRVNTVLLGPGNGVTDETRHKVVVTLREKRATVLDADALTVFQDDPKYLFNWIKGPAVLTPHEGEFARLFDTTSDKITNCKAAADLSGAVVISKGYDTVIASPDGRTVVNNNAPSTLATAGSGDVLSGIIVGLLAQGMPMFEAASAGVWLHGEAANSFGMGLIAEDIVKAIPGVIQSL